MREQVEDKGVEGGRRCQRIGWLVEDTQDDGSEAGVERRCGACRKTHRKLMGKKQSSNRGKVT
jgi:bacterioferritin-associated ferredoxin